MPFFRVRTAFPGLPVIPHCKKISDFALLPATPITVRHTIFTESYAGGRRRGVFLRPASAVRSRFCRPVSLSPSGPVPAVFSPACAVRFSSPLPAKSLCGHNRPQAFRRAGFSLGSAIRLRARIRRCRKLFRLGLTPAWLRYSPVKGAAVEPEPFIGRRSTIQSGCFSASSLRGFTISGSIQIPNFIPFWWAYDAM